MQLPVPGCQCERASTARKIERSSQQRSTKRQQIPRCARNDNWTSSNWQPSTGNCRLAQAFFHFAQPVGALQNFAGLRAIGGTDDPVLLHQINQVCGAAITDTETPLEQGSGSLSKFQDELY